MCVCVCIFIYVCIYTHICPSIQHHMLYHHNRSYSPPPVRGGGLGSRPKKMYGEIFGDGVEYHLMNPRPVVKYHLRRGVGLIKWYSTPSPNISQYIFLGLDPSPPPLHTWCLCVCVSVTYMYIFTYIYMCMCFLEFVGVYILNICLHKLKETHTHVYARVYIHVS